MSNCAGSWLSKRFDDESSTPDKPIEEDYTIIIDPHPGNIDITGRRTKGAQTDSILPGGKCKAGHNSRDIVTFTIREASNRTIAYRGFVVGDKIAEGYWRRVGGPPEGGDSGTWEASKESKRDDKDSNRQETEYKR